MSSQPITRSRYFLHSLYVAVLLLFPLVQCQSTSNQPLYLSVIQSQLLLDLHNSLRSSVTPPSANMQGLYWDNDLATSAANLAATCPTATSTSSSASSTNVAYIPPFAADGTQGTIAQLPISNALTAWTAPAMYYNFNANTCGSTSGCLSWLNLVYAQSYTIGCGLSSQQCSSVPVTFANTSEVIGSGYAIVCMYASGGASTASPPYTAGLSCGGCPANFAYCSIPSTCVASSGTCPALCSVQGGLRSGLAGTIVGVVLGFIILVVLSIYGYSVYWWREHGLYGNVKPTYKYTKAISKDDEDGNSNRALADAPLSSTVSSIPLSLPKQTPPPVEPVSPVPTAQPVKTPLTTATTSATTGATASTAAANTAVAATTATPAASPAPPVATAAAAAAKTAVAATPPTKPKPVTTPATTKSTLAASKAAPAVPAKPVSPSNIHLTSKAGLSARPSGPSSPKSPKSPKSDTMPEGWSLHKDASGNQYFFNTTTGQSQWSKPSK